MNEEFGMSENHFAEIIEEQTKRALWEVKNVIDCVPDELWNKKKNNRITRKGIHQAT